MTGCVGRDAGRPEGKAGVAGGDAGCPAGGGAAGSGGVGAESGSSRIQALRLSETPRSMSSLSPRSSLSSLSPPCSPLVTDTSFLSGETFAGQAGPGGLSLDLELHSRLAELELSLDSKEQRQEEHRSPEELEEKQNHNNTLGEEVKGKQEDFVPLFCGFIQNYKIPVRAERYAKIHHFAVILTDKSHDFSGNFCISFRKKIDFLWNKHVPLGLQNVIYRVGHAASQCLRFGYYFD